MNPASQTTFRALMRIGQALIVAGVAILGYIYWWKFSSNKYDENWVVHSSPFDFWHWLAPVAVGSLLWVFASSREKYWHLDAVGTAKVLKHKEYPNFNSGNSYALLVDGKNRAGKRGQYTVYTCSLYWNQIKDGDSVNVLADGDVELS